MVFLFLCLAACMRRPALARAKTDILVMTNGDRITCEVKNLEAGVLSVNLDYVDGTISVDWLKVARLESSALFLVQLQDGSIYAGKVIGAETLPGTPVKLTIQPEDEPESLTVNRATVVRMTQFSESFFRRFSGKITLGATYAKGNSTTQYNFGSELDYQQSRWGARVSYNSNLSSSTGAETATRNQIDWSAYRLLPRPNYFVAGIGGFLQSSVQGIQRQTSVGIGLGRFLKNTNRFHISVLGGLGWQGTSYVQPEESQPTQNIGVALVSSNLQADAVGTQRHRSSRSDRARASLRQDQRILLPEAFRENRLEPFLLRKLGHPAAAKFPGQRLREQHRVQLDLWKQVRDVRCARRAGQGRPGACVTDRSRRGNEKREPLFHRRASACRSYLTGRFAVACQSQRLPPAGSRIFSGRERYRRTPIMESRRSGVWKTSTSPGFRWRIIRS